MNKIIKSFKWIIIGLLIGILTGYLRGFKSSSFWSLSDIAGRYGFWLFTVSLIAFYSKNKKEAFINCLFYMIFMCISYYGYLYIFKHILYTKQFMFWSLFSILSSLYGMLINVSKENKSNSHVLISMLPIVMIGIEMVAMLNYFIRYKTNFIQLLVDLTGFLVLMYLFQKNKSLKDKKLLIIGSITFIVIVCLIFAFL